MKDQYVSVEHLLLGLTKVKSRAQDPARRAGDHREGRPRRRCRRSAAGSG